MKPRTSDAKDGAHRSRNSALESCDPFCSHDTADIDCTGRKECLNGITYIVAIDLAMSIQSDDVLMTGLLDRKIESVRRPPGRVLHQENTCVLVREPLSDLLCAIARRAYGENDFDLSSILLLQHRPHSSDEMICLVQDGDHH